MAIPWLTAVVRRTLAIAVLSVSHQCRAQKGLGSLNDPCDCMQHHDFWMSIRGHLKDLFWADDFPKRMFDPSDAVHRWVMVQSCMYSPENEDSHRPTALSDCIPGFLLVHVVCMQRNLAERRPRRVMEYAAELMRLLPFGIHCLDTSGWPISSTHMIQYYRRVRRVFAAGPPEGTPWPQELLIAMAWHPPSQQELESGSTVLGEEAEVCPRGALPDCGVCWILGPPGTACGKACSLAAMEFRQPQEWQREPIVPRILGLSDALPDKFLMQHDWGPYECYVSGEGRFHLAAPQDILPEEWSYPVCELACPCAPALPPSVWDALVSVPPLD